MDTKQPKKSELPRAKILSHLTASLVTAIFVVVLMQFGLDGMQGFLLDTHFRIRPAVEPHSNIVLIAYDDSSATKYLENTKIPSLEIEQVFNQLAQAKPKAVGVIASINDKVYSNDEMQQIASAFQKVPNTLIGYIDDESFGKLQPTPLLEFPYLPGFISRDNFSYGADSVSRRMMITIRGLPTLYSDLARIQKEVQSTPVFDHAHPFGETGSTQVFINWQGPPNTYYQYSSSSVALGGVNPEVFKDKIVLFGSALSGRQARDFIFTPYSRNLNTTTLIEGAAHGLATLLENNAIYKSPFYLNLLVSLLVGLLTVNMVIYLAPVRGILFTLGTVLVLYLGSFLVFQFANCWMDLAHPVIVACLSYYLVIPYRLVSEYRTRWHFQNENEMMAELEQLKSNFLNLVSHDLKTPIARIQGNAEIIKTSDLPHDWKGAKNVEDILETTDSLGQYVESILDLTKIDSNRMALNKSTKDINSIILSVIENKKRYAIDKDIEISSNLEPIFAFSFDAKLINRVLENLVENAIKYSPRGSKVVLTSHEEENWVNVSVSDQGHGIEEEDQARIFTKFYRCQNESTASNKGTGLGLYLVKYFIELHNGFVDLKSDTGKGSRFTIGLPV